MIHLFWYTLPALVAAIVAFALTPLVARLAVRIGAIDMPGERKLHTAPIPRLGGLAVVASIALVMLGSTWLSNGRWRLSSHLAPGLGFGVLPVLVVSLLDDIRSVGARTKFLVHTLGATIAVSFGISLDPVVHLLGTPLHIGVLAAPLSVLWIVGVTNAFNIIDGLDGLSAGLALIAATSMAAVFALVGQADMAAVALVLVGALAGFLPYNTYPARLFLGDTGSTAIGFCLATFALKGGSTLSSGFAALLPVFMLGLPIADTFIAMMRRTLARLENHTGGMLVPDSNHIHHRLLALGIDHGRAVLILYGAGLVLAGAAFLSMFLTAHDAALFVVALLLAGFIGVHRLGYHEFAFLKRGTILKVYKMPAVKRGMFVVYVDTILAIAAAYLVVGLKTDHWSFSFVRHPVLDLVTTFAPVTVLVFWWSGMYRGSWRVSGLDDLTRAFKAVAIVTLVGALLVRPLSGAEYSPSMFGIYGLISLMLTASLRASYVVLENTRLRSSHQGIPVLIYGADVRGVAAVRELFQNSAAGLKPIGFIDDDPRARGKLVSGLPVFGTERELEGIIHTHKAQGLLVAAETISPERLERAAQTCKQADARMFRLNVKVERFGESVPFEEHADGLEPMRAAEMEQPMHAAEPGNAAPMGLLETLHVLGSGPCPSCGSREVHRSKARTLYEKLRKAHTLKRMFRCHHCGWRGWLLPLDSAVTSEATWSPDLTAIDTFLGADRLRSPLSMNDVQHGPAGTARHAPRVALFAHALLVVALAWGAFAFGAVYPWGYWSLIAAVLTVSLIGLAVRARDLAPTPGMIALAGGLCLFLVAGLVQLVPLPLTRVTAVSPESARAIAQLDLAVAAGATRWHPLSIAPALTGIGLVLFASNALLVLGCARLLSLRGARRIAEALAVLGVAVALAGIIQKPLFNGKIYGFWTPLDGGNPFGPFVNRNHFAGWMLMVLPVTLGLLFGGIARAMHGVKPNWRDRLLWLASAEASRLMLLAAGAMVMTLSLVLTLSRSGIAALALAVVIAGGFVARRQRNGRRGVALAYLLVLVVAVVGWAGADAVASRFAQADWGELNNRRGAWTDAVDVASRFPATGTGLNTYGVATLLYQRHDLSMYYSQAHNDYLQLAAEGGLLLTVPAALCLGLLILAVRRRFVHETSTTAYWLRVGAVTGLTAIGLQETVDFSLQMPGNAALFAVLCAIALHRAPERRTA